MKALDKERKKMNQLIVIDIYLHLMSPIQALIDGRFFDLALLISISDEDRPSSNFASFIFISSDY